VHCPGRDVLARCMALKKPDGSLQFDDKGLRDVILNFIIAGANSAAIVTVSQRITVLQELGVFLRSIITAGRDTTAQALSWTMVCLMGLHPGGGTKEALKLVQVRAAFALFSLARNI
jgi:cytochrome P450